MTLGKISRPASLRNIIKCVCNALRTGAHVESGRLVVERAEVEALQREWQHQEDVMQRLADPTTPEGNVAHKAYRRIGELIDELKLDESHIELAQQASSNPLHASLCCHCCFSHVQHPVAAFVS